MRSETKELQEKKEEMQTDLVVLKIAVDETKSEVDYKISINYFTKYNILVHTCRIRIKNLYKQRGK